MDIDKGPKSLKKQFEGDNLVEIPSFQRNYVWKKENVKQLLDDAFAAGERGDTHFFGPVVLLKQNGSFEIVDGQQRVTTSIIAISLLRDILIDKAYFPDSESEFIDDLRNAWNGFLFKSGIGKKPKFRAGYLIRDLFDAAILPDPASRTKEVRSRGAGLSKSEVADTKELRKVYEFARDYLNKIFLPLSVAQRKDTMKQIYNGFSENFQIHSMVVTDELDAYQLFESINYLGIKLEPGDLLKSLTLRTIQKGKPAELDAAIDRWDEFVDALGGYKLSKFLRHYLLTQSKGKVQASKIFPVFKGIVSVSADAAIENLERMNEASSLYGFLLGSPLPGSGLTSKMAEIAVKLNIISDTHRVLLLQILLQKQLNVVQKEKAFRAVEYLVFRTVCARENAQETEDKYQALGHELREVTSEGDLDNWVAKVCKGLLTDEQLKQYQVSNTSKLGIHHDPREDLARYALAVITSEMSMGWTVDTTLEHLAPQNPNEAAKWQTKVGTKDDAYSSVIHWWGNLTLLESALNSAIGNREWAVKLTGDPSKNQKGLNDSGFALTKEVVKRSDWNQKEIESRGIWILETLLWLRSEDWVKTGQAQTPHPAWW